MPADKENVQTDAALENTEAAPTQEPETTPEAEGEQEQTQPQFLTKDEVKQMLADERERIRQSSRDISRTEIEKAKQDADYYRRLALGYDTEFGQEDPDKAESIKTKARLAAMEAQQAAGQRSQQAQAAVASFENTMTSYVSDLGLNPDEIDWGKDVPTNSPGYFQIRQQKILSSAAKAQKEAAKTKESAMEKRLKVLEAKLGEDANSVDAAASEGAGSGTSDEKFLEQWNIGVLPATKENVARVQKLINK